MRGMRRGRRGGEGKGGEGRGGKEGRGRKGWKERLEWREEEGMGGEGRQIPEVFGCRSTPIIEGSFCFLLPLSSSFVLPQGVMISHDNLTWTAGVCAHLYQLDYEDHMISYLPLSHIAAQMMVSFVFTLPFSKPLTIVSYRYQDIHAPLHTGMTIHFAQPDALKGSLAQTLKVS